MSHKLTNKILTALAEHNRVMHTSVVYTVLSPPGFIMGGEMKRRVWKSILYLEKKGDLKFLDQYPQKGPFIVLPKWLTPKGNLKAQYK